MDGDEEFAVAYSGVSLGIPVLARDGQQFGFLEHVLAVEEEDIFEGFVVWVGAQPGAVLDGRSVLGGRKGVRTDAFSSVKHGSSAETDCWGTRGAAGRAKYVE